MPVQFICPNCRRKLSVTRRKVGHQVACPKCEAPVIVPAAPALLAAGGDRFSMPAELDEPDIGGLMDFNDLPDLMSERAPLRPMRLPTVVPYKEEELVAPDPVVSVRTPIYLQAVLLVLVATVAFGMGYWLGRATG